MHDEVVVVVKKKDLMMSQGRLINPVGEVHVP